MKFIRWLIVLVTLLGVLLGGYYAYISTRQARLLSQARRYLAKSNTETAVRCLRRALGYDPHSLEACRLMAQAGDQVSSPAALLWRSRVVELSPKSLTDRIALAQTALVYRDYLTATNALEGVSSADKETPEYHNVAGATAAAMHQLAAAEMHFLAASRLEPTNAIPRLNLAVVRLQSTNSQVMTLARATLRSLCTNSVLRSQALRELVADALHTGQAGGALTFSGDLLQETNTVFSDVLLRLDVLHDSRNEEFQKALAGVQQQAASDARKTYELVMWQAARGGPSEALAWLHTLPPQNQTNQPAALLMAQCLTAMNAWADLQASLTAQNWFELDFVRRAYNSLALRGQGLSSSASIEWDKAFKATGGRKENLVMLLRLAAAWNWVNEAEDLLWDVIHNFPAERWASVALTRNFLLEGRTRSLMALYSDQARMSPADLSIKNNLAMTALLLNEKAMRPHDLAREVYAKVPTNAAYASTYAFSLYLQDRNEEALKVLEQLKPRQLQDPGIALYYALVLRATGNSQRAEEYRALASRVHLLPEERKLLLAATEMEKQKVESRK